MVPDEIADEYRKAMTVGRIAFLLEREQLDEDAFNSLAEIAREMKPVPEEFQAVWGAVDLKDLFA